MAQHEQALKKPFRGCRMGWVQRHKAGREISGGGRSGEVFHLLGKSKNSWLVYLKDQTASAPYLQIRSSNIAAHPQGHSTLEADTGEDYRRQQRGNPISLSHSPSTVEAEHPAVLTQV